MDFNHQSVTKILSKKSVIKKVYARVKTWWYAVQNKNKEFLSFFDFHLNQH